MGQLQLITSNPVTDEFDRRTAIANQQAAQDLQNTAAQQAIDYNSQANPIRLRDITSAADINAAGAKVAGATTQDKIAQSGAEAENAGLTTTYNRDTLPSREQQQADSARETGANADVAVGTVQPKISQANSAAQEGAANAQVATGTVGSRIAESGANAATAGSNAQTAAAGAQVATATVPAKIAEATSQQQLAAAQAALAQNTVQYDKEGRFMDLYAKNPQAALASAGQYGAPPELVAALQDQTKAAWISQAWASISAQYPGDANVALRASIFEQKIKESQASPGVPNATSAQTVPAGTPAPMNSIDQRAQLATKYLGMTPGTQSYAYYVSTGKLPAGQPITGEAAKALGLDPNRVWQQGADNTFKPIDNLTEIQRNYLAAQNDPTKPFRGSITDFMQRTKGAASSLEVRAQAAGLVPDSEDYKAFMLTNGQVGDPATIDSTVKMIGEYKIAPPTGQALRTAWGQKVLAGLSAAYPSYNATTYGERQKAMRDFGTGQQGNTIRSLDVAISHLNVLDQLGKALTNGDTRLFNQWAQYLARETGGTAPTDFNAAKQVVAGEVVKAITANGGALHDREEAASAIQAANSPEQLAGVTRQYRRLLAGQLGGLRKQYESSTGQGDFNTRLRPETTRELDALDAADTANSPGVDGAADIPVPADLPQGTTSAGKTKDGRNAWRLPDGSLVAE